MRIGVLALQGGFIEHLQMLNNLEVPAVEVRLPEHLEGLDGLIIPGGESTTIAKLVFQYNLMAPLCRFATQRPVWGTCAGLILLAKKVDRDQPLLGVMDITVRRNAFGRQVASFITDIAVPDFEDSLKRPFPAVFIRAPQIVDYSETVGVLARLPDGRPVAVRQHNLLATSFHPELTSDIRFHRYFLKMATDDAH